MGLVVDEDDYKVCYGAKLIKTTRSAIYNEDISNNATNVVLSKAEAVHTAKIADYQLFAAAKNETWDFIPAVIEDIWVRKLCEPVTLYTAISQSGLLVFNLLVLLINSQGIIEFLYVKRWIRML